MTLAFLFRALERATVDEDTAVRSIALAAHYRNGFVPEYHLAMYRRAMMRRERIASAVYRRTWADAKEVA